GDVWALHAVAARDTALVAPQRAGAARALPAAAGLWALAGRDAGAAPGRRARMVAPPHGHRRARLGGVAGPRPTGDGRVASGSHYGTAVGESTEEGPAPGSGAGSARVTCTLEMRV